MSDTTVKPYLKWKRGTANRKMRPFALEKPGTHLVWRDQSQGHYSDDGVLTNASHEGGIRAVRRWRKQARADRRSQTKAARAHGRAELRREVSERFMLAVEHAMDVVKKPSCYWCSRPMRKVLVVKAKEGTVPLSWCGNSDCLPESVRAAGGER